MTTDSADDPPRQPVTEARDWRPRQIADYLRVSLKQGRDLRRALDDTAYVFGAPSRKPRVFLEGDTVPAGAWVLDRVGGVYPVGPGYVVDVAPVGPLVEVSVPDYAAAVAAERERRARNEPSVAADGVGDPETRTGGAAPASEAPRGPHGASQGDGFGAGSAQALAGAGVRQSEAHDAREAAQGAVEGADATGCRRWCASGAVADGFLITDSWSIILDRPGQPADGGPRLPGISASRICCWPATE